MKQHTIENRNRDLRGIAEELHNTYGIAYKQIAKTCNINYTQFSGWRNKDFDAGFKQLQRLARLEKMLETHTTIAKYMNTELF